MDPRVVVSGLGVVSPLGTELEDFWQALLYADSAPEEYPHAHPERLPNRLAYRVPDGPDARPAGSRTVAFALRAAEAALRDAGLAPAPEGTLIGACVATATGNQDVLEARRLGLAAPPPLEAYPFSVAPALATRLDLGGPVVTLSTACAAGCYSLSLAAQALADERADVMLVVGADSISRVTQACFNRMNALDPLVCRPFDAERAGTVYGEGAAALVLETEAHARRRGRAHAYALVAGSGWSCDGHHATAPDPAGVQIERALQRALDDAGLGLGDIDCIVAHGTGTELNDLAESHVMEQAFGADLERLSVCAPKSKLGHTAGAAGAFACLTAALILDRGLVPPTANLTRIDPRCRLPLHTDWPRPLAARHVLVNAYAFGGNNISVILGAA